MNKYTSIIFKHWKTTAGGVLVAAFTVMLWQKIITMTDWAMAMGTLATVLGFISKDPDKTQSKPD